jgi:hypothetical protein
MRYLLLLELAVLSSSSSLLLTLTMVSVTAMCWQVFGLHPNFQHAVHAAEVSNTIAGLLKASVLFAEEGAGTGTPTSQLNKVNAVMSSLPLSLPAEQLRVRLGVFTLCGAFATSSPGFAAPHV